MSKIIIGDEYYYINPKDLHSYREKVKVVKSLGLIDNINEWFEVKSISHYGTFGANSKNLFLTETEMEFHIFNSNEEERLKWINELSSKEEVLSNLYREFSYHNNWIASEVMKDKIFEYFGVKVGKQDVVFPTVSGVEKSDKL